MAHQLDEIRHRASDSEVYAEHMKGTYRYVYDDCFLLKSSRHFQPRWNE
jgi:hypothetical protein